MELVKPAFGLIFWMCISFGLILFILKKFAWGPILNMLHEREASIEEALSAAQKAKEEMMQLQNNNEKLVAEARAERDKMLKEARDVKETIINDAKQKATQDAQRIVAEARKNIETEKMAAIGELKNQVALMSVEIAEKILSKELASDENQKTLVNNLIKDIKLN